MKKTAVVNVVGLSQRLLDERLPFLSQWAKNKSVAAIDTVLPAVTCSSQATYLTGKWPTEHGIVGNGWFFKDTQEVSLWKQSNKLVQAQSVWDNIREEKPEFTVANMFWWFNMYSTADYSVTPRPQYRANGLKIPDCYAWPSELRDRLQEELGTFPLFHFWGPKTTVKSSKWIAEASMKVHDWHNPDLMLVYLPHLDYVLQKYGHDDQFLAKDLLEIDKVCENLITHLEAKGVEVMVLSEYGITNVSRPVHVNRVLREMDLIAVREENGLELLDGGQSKAFAVSDHQIAHVYVQDKAVLPQVKERLAALPGVELVLDDEGKEKYNIAHERAGDLVLLADKDSWFTYYYWLDDAKAPDFARTVDIHKKPGYDPAEMFFDPEKSVVMLRAALKLLGKKLGFRTTMDLIGLDATLIKGSHGRNPESNLDKAIFIGGGEYEELISPIAVHDIIKSNCLKD
ncbi:alkaline phosphatase family protein [Marinilongibacter aquaticus]|uniref:alkaline phosphatase family protein n=1 Tax=Marinilongibacter aquaticus TaxID=2975157 RepID=UPI0021BD75EA|nr:nucleotide pyrophosphatase/phosphodiesterase family protein [Marinilongibacter aquaticus]UBM58504.1 alkaline phosphatase family protein [Marinilongibacter aquaticus]